MRTVNTLEFEYKSTNGRFADVDELRKFAQSGKQTEAAQNFSTRMKTDLLSPYSLAVYPSRDGAHYVAEIKRATDMHDSSTWCHTAAYSDDAGVIDVGQNIGCSGAAALASSSRP